MQYFASLYVCCVLVHAMLQKILLNGSLSHTQQQPQLLRNHRQLHRYCSTKPHDDRRVATCGRGKRDVASNQKLAVLFPRLNASTTEPNEIVKPTRWTSFLSAAQDKGSEFRSSGIFTKKECCGGNSRWQALAASRMNEIHIYTNPKNSIINLFIYLEIIKLCRIVSANHATLKTLPSVRASHHEEKARGRGGRATEGPWHRGWGWKLETRLHVFEAFGFGVMHCNCVVAAFLEDDFDLKGQVELLSRQRVKQIGSSGGKAFEKVNNSAMDSW